MYKKYFLFILVVATSQISVNAQLVKTLANLNQGTMGDGITVATTGDIFYSSGFGTQFNKIYRITPDGEFSVFVENISNPVGIISDSLLNLYVPTYQGNSIRKIDSTGVVTEIATGLNGPAGIVINKKGEIFISEFGAGGSGTGNRIMRIDTSGVLDTFVSNASFKGLIGLTIDEKGNLYTSNWPNGNIFKITPEKEVTLLADIAGNVNQISYSNGYLLVPSPTTRKIFRVDLSGNVELLAGTGGNGNKGGASIEAVFARPNGIAPSITGDTLYFNDNGLVKMIIGMNLPKIGLKGSFKSNSISLNTNAEKNYDSLSVVVDGIIQETLYTVSEEDSVFEIEYIPEETTLSDIYVYGFSGPKLTVSSKAEVIITSFKDPIEGYVTDFDDRPTSDFLSIGFSIQRNLTDLRNYQANTVHDYKANFDYSLTLKRPIILSESNSELIYSDVAIVEPGEEGSKFGDPTFKDYVVVEATKNGEWLALADGYDSNFDADWLTTWPENGNSEELFRPHTINMLDTFNAGDTVLVRFRLYSDSDSTGYGWVINEIKIQESLATSIDDDLVSVFTFNLEQNYPNPFNPSTTIQYSISSISNVKLSIFDITGREVVELVNQRQNAGSYSVKFNADYLSSGMYFYRLETEQGFSKTNKMLLIK